MFTSIKSGKEELAKINAEKIQELRGERATVQNEIDLLYDDDNPGDANLLHRQKVMNLDLEISLLQAEVEDAEYNQFLLNYHPLLTDNDDFFSSPKTPSYEEWLSNKAS